MMGRGDSIIAGEAVQVEALIAGCLSDPFALLGPHDTECGRVLRVFLPGALGVQVFGTDQPATLINLPQVHPSGYFAGVIGKLKAYRLQITWPGAEQHTADPYAFGLLLGELDLHLLNEGRHLRLSECLGAKAMTVDGVAGVRFSVWAPNARRVSVVGDFNNWDGRRHSMRLRHGAGVWELFVPDVQVGACYKYELLAHDGSLLPLKADPVARQAEPPPSTASVVSSPEPFVWNDAPWMAERAARQSPSAPLSIYEVHVGSWMRGTDGEAPHWDVLGERLIGYTAEMGFTHIELLPIAEHPFAGSWGYQPLGLFAPTARHGSPEAFARFIDRCHQRGIGVIVDWVPAHFPTDAHGLARFDGTALYEHADPREGFHHDWKTLIYNHGRNEVVGFLIASALEWIERFHVDGLRVDAVASMLYRDYSRRAGEWIPNVHGGRENYEAVEFLRRLNQTVTEHCPSAIVIAEESTAWPGVSRPVDHGGLGFSYKWNMGWMHDTLRYIARDPVYRRYHHNDLTFGLLYAFSENFVLPISHDEVVHGKGSLLGRMPGDHWQRFANLRAYLAYMWAHPGKKLLFMGCEMAQPSEWNADGELDWGLLDDSMHRGVQQLTRDLNRTYVSRPALHAGDSVADGFRWIVGDDAVNSVLAFLRSTPGGDACMLAVFNMTPVVHYGYRIGVPHDGRWREVLNTDAGVYGGSNVGNGGGLLTELQPMHGEAQSLSLTLPPMAGLLLEPVD
ncbi:MAG TPA: 1,4-alpha-glucan branching protein GlgB [Gammaproteobacteria bacterium]|nr:1,4-alpha-glucan branching protein GlgB [Gammaproteobacteria bacterium]